VRTCWPYTDGFSADHTVLSSHVALTYDNSTVGQQQLHQEHRPRIWQRKPAGYVQPAAAGAPAACVAYGESGPKDISVCPNNLISISVKISISASWFVGAFDCRRVGLSASWLSANWIVGELRWRVSHHIIISSSSSLGRLGLLEDLLADLSPPFPLVQIRINIHSFLVPFVTGIHSPLNHAYS